MSISTRTANTATRELLSQGQRGSFTDVSTQTNDDCGDEMDLDSWEIVPSLDGDRHPELWPATGNRLPKPRCAASAINRHSSPLVRNPQGALLRTVVIPPRIQSQEMAAQILHQRRLGFISDGESSVDPMANSTFSAPGRRMSTSTNASDRDSVCCPALDKLSRNTQSMGQPPQRAAQEGTTLPQALDGLPLPNPSKAIAEPSHTCAQHNQAQNQMETASLSCCHGKRHKELCEYYPDGFDDGGGGPCIDDSFWEWDQKTQQYRHWDSEDEEYIYCPDAFD